MAPSLATRSDRECRSNDSVESTCGYSPPVSRSSSYDSLPALPPLVKSPPSLATTTPSSTTTAPAGKTLKSKSKVPTSMYIVAAVVLGSQYSGGVYSAHVPRSLLRSYVTSGHALSTYMQYLRDILHAVSTGRGGSYSLSEKLLASCCTLFVALIFYVLLYVPFRAGMWTGKRAGKHKLHRYLGLFFLIQYFTAWVEFIANYDNGVSYLPHFIALTGIIQGVSAYFSFRVLPELADPGYYSDKAVLSRTFIHENTYFATITYLGSCLYHDTIRTQMMAHPVGRVLTFIFVYWNYIILRPFFPITSFSNAGASGRSERNAQFYRVGTVMVKIFYLWGKYFLGFMLNWVIYLGLATDRDMRFVRGLFLTNVGTMSISVFLHTLRFKKALPPTLTFSIYLLQIYGTFLALPYSYDMFSGHKRLLALTTLGLVINMTTRKRWMHGLWCGLCVCLLEFTDIAW